MRLFFAIGLPEAAKAVAQGVQGCLEREAPGQVRWTKPEHMHLTLYFMGEVHEEQSRIVEAAADSVALERLELAWGGLLLLPNDRNPRVVGLHMVGDVERLMGFQARLSGAVEQLGALREDREYRPHVTVGRARQERRGSAKAIKRAVAGCRVPSGLSFGVESFELVRSVLTSDGPRYETLRSFPAR